MFDLLTNPIGVLSGLGLLLALFLGVWAHGKAKGKKAAQETAMRERAKARTIADKIDDAVAGRDAETNRGRLGKWAGQ